MLNFPRTRPRRALVTAGLSSLLFAFAFSPLACGGSGEDEGDKKEGEGSDFAPTGGTGGVGIGGSGEAESEGSLSGIGGDGTLGRAGFRFGINLGHPNPMFDDAMMSDLASEVGVRSIRLKYPEYHFENWGQEIELADAEHYASLGMSNHVAFVIGMTEEHSTAPEGSADWERDHYIPKNLYEPIFKTDGSVNPENFYAQYLADTFQTYKSYVKYWEIFNEPDWVNDWQVTLDWDTTPPSAEELVRFHGSIFDYIRMLRIASVVRDQVAPGTYILTGGLGYPSFLNAILRYTDNPDGGKESAEFPKKGGAYFDVLSTHHYPHLVEDGPSDAALQSFIDSRNAFAAELEKAGVAGKGLMVTENGASHEATMSVASGPEYARNYLQKSFIWAKAEGFLGIDWFTLSDGTDSSDAFARMGLYEDVSSLASTDLAVESTNGRAYLTTSRLLSDARLNVDKTMALSLPSGVVGYVFSEGSKAVYALWAETEDGETASQEITLPLSGSVEFYPWDSDGVTPSSTETPSGTLTVKLSASPIFLTVEGG